MVLNINDLFLRGKSDYRLFRLKIFTEKFYNCFFENFLKIFQSKNFFSVKKVSDKNTKVNYDFNKISGRKYQRI